MSDERLINIAIDQRTYDLLRVAQQLLKAPQSEVLHRALRAIVEPRTRPRHDPWDPVAIYVEYAGRRIEAMFLPATRRVVIKSEPLAQRKFKSPSGAARAVVAALNPARTQAQGNGWRFWRLAETDERLEVLRQS